MDEDVGMRNGRQICTMSMSFLYQWLQMCCSLDSGELLYKSTSQTLDLQPAEELYIDDTFRELAFDLYYYSLCDSILDRKAMKIAKIADFVQSQDLFIVFCSVLMWKQESEQIYETIQLFIHVPIACSQVIIWPSDEKHENFF